MTPHMPPFLLGEFMDTFWIVLAEPWVITAIVFVGLVIVGMLVAARHNPMDRELRMMQYDYLVRQANRNAMHEAKRRAAVARIEQKRKGA